MGSDSEHWLSFHPSLGMAPCAAELREQVIVFPRCGCRWRGLGLCRRNPTPSRPLWRLQLRPDAKGRAILPADTVRRVQGAASRGACWSWSHLLSPLPPPPMSPWFVLTFHPWLPSDCADVGAFPTWATALHCSSFGVKAALSVGTLAMWSPITRRSRLGEMG